MKLEKKMIIIVVIGCLGLLNCRPDLTVSIDGAKNSYREGEDAGASLKIIVYNKGSTKALGTNDAGADGYMVDLVLSTDTHVPVQFAVLPIPYTFTEDMLLKGGRISNSVTLAPGQSKTYLVGGEIPRGSPSAAYLCAVVDPGKKIDESDENNNTDFRPVNILP